MEKEKDSYNVVLVVGKIDYFDLEYKIISILCGDRRVTGLLTDGVATGLAEVPHDLRDTLVGLRGYLRTNQGCLEFIVESCFYE